jgi:hypothetical protein
MATATAQPNRLVWPLRPRWWWFPVVSLALTVALLVWFYVALGALGPIYEYRLVTPPEAIRLVNDEGWRVSERVRMTDQAVYIYRKRP